MFWAGIERAAGGHSRDLWTKAKSQLHFEQQPECRHCITIKEPASDGEKTQGTPFQDNEEDTLKRAL